MLRFRLERLPSSSCRWAS
ncbi:hypothetical protein FJ967_08850 [Mesorhizobium sp. B2-3-4]|nr:hypothetical protein FJ967_08850 [Mesorhizobium sp. B2-3-4]